jgi:hypothetical protein
LAIETGDAFDEITVESLQVDSTDTIEAAARSECGIAYDGSAIRCKKGCRVFMVQPAA